MNRDADGFLINTSDWSTEVMNQMAIEDGFEITDEVEKYIMKAREMFNTTGTVPAVRVFAKEFGMDRKAKELYEVFESGPMKKIAKYGGLPKPTWLCKNTNEICINNGAKSELGMELATLYAKNNYNLYLAGRSIEKIRPQSEVLEKQYNNKVTLCELDVTDTSSIKDFYNSLKIKPIGIDLCGRLLS